MRKKTLDYVLEFFAPVHLILVRQLAKSDIPSCLSSWHDWKFGVEFTLFGLLISVAWRSRSDVTDWLSYWVMVSIDLTDVTLVSDDT